MLAYCEKLVLTPSEMSPADVELLHDQGLSDQEVLALVLVAGFFMLATRIADGLGVELDPQLTHGEPEYRAYFEGRAR